MIAILRQGLIPIGGNAHVYVLWGIALKMVSPSLIGENRRSGLVRVALTIIFRPQFNLGIGDGGAVAAR